MWGSLSEKALAGARGSGDLDSGVGRRILGTILTWMAERHSDVFIFATSNQVWQLPPELLRKGRFDELFFLRNPKDTERREIFAIHIAKRGRDPKRFNLDALVKASDGFTGSEIEEAIIAGMFDAFEHDAEVTTTHIVSACKATKPMAVTMADDIQRLEDWGTKRARPASSAPHSKGEDFRRHMEAEHA